VDIFVTQYIASSYRQAVSDCQLLCWGTADLKCSTFGDLPYL